MKKLIMVFAALAMAAIGFVACPQPAGNSVSRVKDATNYYGGDIYTTVEYDKSACFEVKLAKKTTALAKANITFAVSDGSDEFPATGIAVVDDSVSEAVTSFKITANQVTPGNQTQGDSPKNVDLTKDFKLIVKVAGAAYGEGGKDVTITSGNIFKARSAKLSQKIEITGEVDTAITPVECKLIITGDSAAAPMEIGDTSKGLLTNACTGLPAGLSVELTKAVAAGDTEINVKISGTPTATNDVALAIVIPGNALAGEELSVNTLESKITVTGNEAP